jgi:nucleoside-diphosphate-sugar epimerase
MKILVLGSDGQIGEPLVEFLSNLHHNVIKFDIYSNPITDLRVPNILDGILSSIDFVFFLAFDVGGSVYLKKYQNSYEFISNNMKIMTNTFDSLKKFNTPFVFASSQMADMSYSSYGLLKHIGEKYVENMNGKVIKFWNVYGFERNIEKAHVITDFILMAKQKNEIEMRTNGDESRQFLYVDDCCKCVSIIMNKFNKIEEKKLDVSSFEWIRIYDIARMIASEFDGCRIFVGNEIDDVQRDALKEPDNKILKYWNPETSIISGITQIIDKYEKSISNW